ncbi:MAG TPA: hypothetical protein VFA20_01635 [Myxococcaceae bacterium]|nr:hypothetical protein [Myxococcaceae bacterium]
MISRATTARPLDASSRGTSASAPAPSSAADRREQQHLSHLLDRFTPAKPLPPGPKPAPGALPHPPGRPSYVTEIDATVTVDKYVGMQHGRNGDHEIAEGHITRILQVGKKKVVDTQNVELAMNVASSKDPAGLPKEIPLKPGQQVEVEGEYIPASKANAHNQAGKAAVIHFTHAPAGFVVIDGHKYQ